MFIPMLDNSKTIRYISRMNWKFLLEKLMATGLKQRAIARSVGVEESVIYRLRKGLQRYIFYTTGVKLVRLASDHGIRI